MMTNQIASMTTPMFAWARTYSHTDRRHWLQIMSGISESLSDLERPEIADKSRLDRKNLELILIRKLPLEGNDPLYDREWDGKSRAFLGATWSQTTPDKLRISTRAAARARDVETYAEMDAKSKNHIALVIEIIL